MIAVIGDVHGCFYTLIELYNSIRKKYKDIPIYCVGDIVDRGNFSCNVMDFMINEKILFTPGNHDYMFYHFFKDPTSIFARSWVFNGNEATLKSYKNQDEKVFKHIEVIRSAPLYYDLPDCFISHAGISIKFGNVLGGLPEKEFSRKIEDVVISNYREDSGVMWTRDPLLNIGKLQIVGHTKQLEIIYIENSDAVYIDTGAFVGNKLSAVIVEDNEIIDSLEAKTSMSDII
ncbi:MAG: diadenosine tetraphosphatase [Ignavibacteria bacterium]|nr:diadenosine tetraphosphatase [Ignavibacteria bacterium]